MKKGLTSSMHKLKTYYEKAKRVTLCFPGTNTITMSKKLMKKFDRFVNDLKQLVQGCNYQESDKMVR